MQIHGAPHDSLGYPLGMIAQTLSATLVGIEAVPIVVEVDLQGGIQGDGGAVLHRCGTARLGGSGE